MEHGRFRWIYGWTDGATRHPAGELDGARPLREAWRAAMRVTREAQGKDRAPVDATPYVSAVDA